MHKRIILLGALLLVLVLTLTCFSSVFALWSAKVSQTNKLVADSTEGSIQETFDSQSRPYGEVQKEVSFKNEGSSAVFLRVAYSETWTAGAGDNAVVLANTVTDESGRHSVADINWALTDWTDGGDGWLYYKKLLLPGTSTDNIVDKVTFPAVYSGVYAPYADADYDLYFRVEMLQASVSPRTLNSDEVNADSLRTVWGKTATVSGTNVSW